MLTIYKYEISEPEFELQLPGNAKPLSVQMQNGKAQLWVLLNIDAPTITRTFRVIGTGHEMELPEFNYQFIGTFQQADIFVWHLFEVIK